MSIRDKLKRNNEPTAKRSSIPTWVDAGNATTKLLYEFSVKEYNRISDLIKSGKTKSLKDRKLVLAKIAKLAGRDRSILTPRRQPQLCDWINRHNDELEALAELHSTTSRQSKNLSKRELEREVSALHRTLEKNSDADKRAIVEEFFSSNLLDDRDKQAREIIRLRNENQRLVEKASHLEQLIQQANREQAELFDLLTDRQRAKLEGLQIV